MGKIKILGTHIILSEMFVEKLHKCPAPTSRSWL